jgi:hypothetical protein
MILMSTILVIVVILFGLAIWATLTNRAYRRAAAIGRVPRWLRIMETTRCYLADEPEPPLGSHPGG